MTATCGWTLGGDGDINRMRALAPELVGLQPDIVLTNTIPATVAVQRETRRRSGTRSPLRGVTDPAASRP
jgi:hypothetical protein